MTDFPFDIAARDGQARTGTLKTSRGDIRTPAFMPVGTAATVKALYMDQVREAGSDIILGNTYHLMLRPGAERVHRLGGLHKFAGWSGPMLTDSGGFQVWSLANLRKLTEEGVTFQSHVDGSKHALTPERSIEIQADLLGSDIVMQLDECTPFPCPKDAARSSMELSLRWAARNPCSVLFKARCLKTCAARARSGSSISDLAAMRLAGSPSVRVLRRCARCSISPRPHCQRIVRAT